MKRTQRILTLMLAVGLCAGLCAGMLSSCGDDTPDGTTTDERGEVVESNEDGDGDDDSAPAESSDGDDNSAPAESSDVDDLLPAEAEIFERYPDVLEISPFRNGVASFATYGGSFYSRRLIVGGYIDLDGNIIIEPNYDIGYTDGQGALYTLMPTVVHSCIKPEKQYQYGNAYAPEAIFDLEGNVLYQVGENDVVYIGDISNGYFWVQTLEGETVAGNLYNTVYYSADTLEPIVIFENYAAIWPTGESRYYTADADVADDGRIEFIRDGDFFHSNIGDYDSTFVPTDGVSSVWSSIDTSSIEAFSGASSVTLVANQYDNRGRNDQYSVAIIRNSAGVYFYSIIDQSGNVILPPQREIAFTDTAYIRCGLCPVQDAESGMWGYMDTKGNWVIQPQYVSATAFTEDGYATVNSRIIIDTNGDVVLAPSSWYAESVSSLSGKFRYTGSDHTGSQIDDSYYLTLTEDGNITCKQYIAALGSEEYVGTYEINGKLITIDADFDSVFCYFPFTEGTYSLTFDGTNLTIGDTQWTLQVDEEE